MESSGPKIKRKDRTILQGIDIHLQQEIVKHPNAPKLFWNLYLKEMERYPLPEEARKRALERLIKKLKIKPLE